MLQYTYGDIVKRVQSLLDDQPGAIYKSDFLVGIVNQAQDVILRHLVSAGLEMLVYRTEPPLVVPAGITELSATPFQVPANEIAFSEDWMQTAGGSLGPPPNGIWLATGVVPTVTPLQADPSGGTGAVKWRFTWAPPYSAGAQIGIPQSETAKNGAAISAAFWVRSLSVPFSMGVSVDWSPGNYTPAFLRVNVGTAWQRVVLPWGPGTITGVTYGHCNLGFSFDSGEVDVILYRFKMEYSQNDTGDVATSGERLQGGTLQLPPGLVVPDQLWESDIGGTNKDFVSMRGPVPLPNIEQTSFLRWWDWREDKVKFIGATADRQVRMDYWGLASDYPSTLTESAATTTPLRLPQIGPALAFAVASLAATSRGQEALADRYMTLTPDGIGGAAGLEIQNIINIEQKAQQSEPVRRRPYFGVVRYPGYGANALGGWPWQSS